ncbi:MAG: 5'-3' exonuclease H3TH domain-containing protein, partial [Candidatus Omnitrophota bacterium]|nr:5'-3' exonuclease H3TH domain-containing protein [Candidatus Omnitrophota bacterium]
MSKKDNSNTKAGKISNGVKIFLIDGNSFCYRAFYAIRNLSTSRGEPTNAVYGFISMLRKIIKDEKPDYLGIAFDMKAPTFRHEKYDDYKAHRKPMPDSLIAQVPVIKEVVRAYNIPIFEKEGFEADDILATIAKKMAEESLDVYIVTGDKDMLQLVGPRVRVYSQHKEGLVYDEEKVIERYGVPPEKIADLIALMGDSSDNIPGVPGFGEKTAVSMMKDFKSLEDIIAKPEKIKQEARKKLLLHNVELARLSRELAVLDDNVPLEIGLSDFRLKEPDAEKLLKLFKRFEFKKLIKEYTPERSLDSRYHLVKDKNGLDGLIEELKKAGLFAFDFETTSADPMAARPIGISFSFKEGEA